VKATKITKVRPPAAPPVHKKFVPRPRPVPPIGPVHVSPTIAVIRRPVLAASVKAAVCQTMAVDWMELAGRTRHPRVVWARRIITRLCRIYTTLSFPEIAQLIGRPNHSTVITSDQTLDRLLQMPRGHSLRLVPLDVASDAIGTDVELVMAAIAKVITRDPVVAVLEPTESARQSA